MKTFFSFVLFFSLLLPGGIKAATADLSLTQDGIQFSKETLISGDTVRIYAVVTNVGEIDVSGYVSFYQGSLPIGDSQIISVRVGGVPEEVFVDFVVPSGDFNIRAEIRGTDPSDTNSENNLSITKLFTPIQDDDRDGVENNKDNCPSEENSDQTDTDVDGLGDVCDDDDDGDGVTDEVEKEIGTDPKKTDTDGDGLSDGSDPHPTIPESQIKIEVSVPVVITPMVSDKKDNLEILVEQKVVDLPSGQEIIGEAEETGLEPEVLNEAFFSTSPNAVFTYQKKSWNTYNFEAQLPSDIGYRVAWDFGDGTTSSYEKIDHVYKKTGDYTVKISVEGAGGEISEDSVVVHISFFSLQNKMIQAVIFILFLILAFLIFLFYRAGRSQLSMPKNKKVIQDPVVSEAVKISVREENSDLE